MSIALWSASRFSRDQLSAKRRLACAWPFLPTFFVMVALLTTLGTISGCGSGTGDQPQNVPVTMNLTFPQHAVVAAAPSPIGRLWAALQSWLPFATEAWAQAVTPVSAIQVDVTAPDLPTSSTTTPIPAGTPSGRTIAIELDVPSGTGRVFTVLGLDSAGRSLYRGKSAPITLTAGQGTSVDVTLTSTPVVTSITPANGALNVSVNPTIQLTFNTPMAQGTISRTSFVITGPTLAEIASATCTNPATPPPPPNSCMGVTLTLGTPLGFDQTYTFAIQPGITDLQGNPLSLGSPGITFPISFTTAASTGTITGSVDDSFENSVAGATVAVNGTTRSATTNADGFFTIPGVPQGQQTLTITAPGYVTATTSLLVAANRTVSAGVITLPPDTTNTTGTVTGRVMEGDFAGIDGATVTVNGFPISDSTVNGGFFTLNGIPEGTQTLTVAATGYVTTTTSVKVLAGASVNAGIISLRPIGTTRSVVGITTATDVAASGYYSCVLLKNGTVQCWGNNQFGQLGNGTTTNSSTPVLVTGITTATIVAVGSSHSCARLTDSTVQCWGNNQFGQLGNGTTTNSSTPVPVVNTTNTGSLTGATAVAAGGYHSCARLADSTLQCWGNGAKGQLGPNIQSTGETGTPVTVTGIETATAIAAGSEHSCALLDNNTVKCFGLNNVGQLGNGTTTNSSTPVSVVNTTNTGVLTGATAVAAGTCVRLQDSTVQCWGTNKFGQLGNGTTEDALTPVPVTGITTATAIAAGERHSCALLNNSTIQCWGDNSAGQLGDGTRVQSLVRVPVTGINTATAVAAGSSHSCARLTDGTVQCWGDNTYGQLGLGR